MSSQGQRIADHQEKVEEIVIDLTLNDLLPHLQYLDDKQGWMLQTVIDICNINSGTYHVEGVNRVRDRLVEEFGQLDGELSLHSVPPQRVVDDKGNWSEKPLGSLIHIRKHPSAKTQIMLCIHMDTVYAEDHEFQTCVELNDGNINGPGVADAKGGLIVMLAALKCLEQSPLAGKIGWEVIINPDEELGSPGSAEFIKERAPHCQFGLLFEPSLPDGTLVSWRKGTGNFCFVARGKSAHSGREFERGRNAIVAVSRLMESIHDLNTEPDVTFNVGRISGGGPLNMVPDLAIGRVNVRAKTVEQSQDAERQLRALVDEIPLEDGISIEMSGGFTSPPKQLSEQAQQLQKRIEACSEALGQNVSWKGTGGASDGNKFAAAGLPNIDTLGPQGGNIHSPNEYLIPSSLVPCAKRVALILMSFAGES